MSMMGGSAGSDGNLAGAMDLLRAASNPGETEKALRKISDAQARASEDLKKQSEKVLGDAHRQAGEIVEAARSEASQMKAEADRAVLLARQREEGVASAEAALNERESVIVAKEAAADGNVAEASRMRQEAQDMRAAVERERQEVADRKRDMHEHVERAFRLHKELAAALAR